MEPAPGVAVAFFAPGAGRSRDATKNRRRDKTAYAASDTRIG
jgi:hypothetical protein